MTSTCMSPLTEITEALVAAAPTQRRRVKDITRRMRKKKNYLINPLLEPSPFTFTSEEKYEKKKLKRYVSTYTRIHTQVSTKRT